MFSQITAILVGMTAGLTWEWLSTTPFQAHPQLVPSLLVPISQKTLHLHHWVGYLVLVCALFLIALRTGRMTHPAVLMIFAFFAGAFIYNFTHLHDWNQFFK